MRNLLFLILMLICTQAHAVKVPDLSTATPVTDDLLYLIDVSDVTDGTTGTGKKVTVAGVVTDALLSTTDITTNDVSTSKHGFAPKPPNDATKYLDGTGSYTVPPGSGTAAGWTRTSPYVYLSTSTDNVGIGTSLPSAKLQVTGSGNISFSGGTVLTGSGTNILNISGNVGLTSAAPGQKLDISNGSIRLTTGSIYVTTGQIYMGSNQGVNITGTTSCTCTRYQAGICTSGTCI